MEYKKLKNIALVTMGQSPKSESYNKHRIGLPFFQGNADFGEIHPNIKMWCSEPKKIANPGDILISVRAPIGAVNITQYKCCIGRGLASISIENSITRDYIYRLLKSEKQILISKGTGSTFKAINKGILEDINVPVVSPQQMSLIVLLLKKAEDSIQYKKNELTKLNELIKARFVEMFGDPVLNSNDYKLIKLSNLGTLSRGKSKHRPRNDPKLLGGPYPLIQTGDITNSGIFIKKYNNTYSKLGLKQSKMWPAGTLCITIAANIAQTAILSFDACFPDSVVGFIPKADIITTTYLHYWFSFFQKILDAQASQVAQKNINLKVLSNLDVAVPPITEQDKFLSFVQQVDKSKFENIVYLNKTLSMKILSQLGDGFRD